MSSTVSPAAAIAREHPLRSDQRGRGQHGHRRVRPQRHRSLDAQVQGHVVRPGRWRPSGPAVHRRPRSAAADGRPGQRQLAAADDDPPADRGPARRRPSRGRRSRRRPRRHRSPGGGPPTSDSAAVIAVGGRRDAGAGHVVGQLGEVRRARCARPPPGRRPSPRRDRWTSVHPQPGVGQRRAARRRRPRSRSATSIRVGRSRCSRPAEPPNRLSITCPAPVEQGAQRRPAGRAAPGRRSARRR